MSERFFAHLVNQLASFIGLLLLCAGCRRADDQSFAGDSLTIDGRYHRVIVFETLQLPIPLPERSYLRVDDPVADTHEHLRALAQELGIAGHQFLFTNPAEGGMHLSLLFRDGKRCSIVWAKKRAEAALMNASLEHEKYHAVCALSPQSIPPLSARIAELGFTVNLAAQDEEFAATIVEILTLHLRGTPLENITGSELVVRAVELLKAHQTKTTAR